MKKIKEALVRFFKSLALTGRRLNGDPDAFRPGAYLRAKRPPPRWF